MRLLIVLTALAVLTTSCGGGDSSEDGVAAGTTSVAESDGGEDQPADMDGSDECPDVPFSGEVSRISEPSIGHNAAALADGELLDAAAFSFGTGFQYTVYVASFEIDDDTMGDTIIAPPGEVLVTFQARGKDGGEIEPGVVYDETFVIIDTGGGAQNSPVDPTGTVEFIAYSEDHLCLNIDFLDENQAITGTVSARVAGGF